MIANITPALSCYEDTLNTLKYAQRAKTIKTNVSKNVSSVTNHVSKYAQLINELKAENEELKTLLQNKQGEEENKFKLDN